MSAIRPDIDAAQIGGAHRSGTVIRLYNAPVIVVINSKCTPLRAALSQFHLARQRHISHRGLHPTPAIYLKHAARRYGTHRREIPRSIGIAELHSVKTSHDVRIPEVS